MTKPTRDECLQWLDNMAIWSLSGHHLGPRDADMLKAIRDMLAHPVNNMAPDEYPDQDGRTDY